MKVDEKKILLLFFGLFLCAFTACKSSYKAASERPGEEFAQSISRMFESSDVFSDNFTGFALYDPQKEAMIYAQNEKRYFTPASNTKLFTFYTGLKLLPDTLPSFNYVENGDSLIIWGTGDPSFLHHELADTTAYNFLRHAPQKIYYSDSHYSDTGLGPGWAWGDYKYAYSAEKSPFPMYGNMVRFKMREVIINTIQSNGDGQLNISPPFFRSYVQEISDSKEGVGEPVLFREFSDNKFRYVPKINTKITATDKPYHYTPQLIVDMLSDTLDKPVEYIERELPDSTETLYSISADTVYKYMLQPSDNFIAEQLLLAASAAIGEPLNSRLAIDKMKSMHLANMPDEPQWVDGSGLSRYNMVTPRSIIWLLQKIDAEFKSDDQLLELFPAGGQSGTIKNWYGPREGGPPYVFAKTGTLSNNHCLSGYLITKNGHKLLFSFMNNHYVTSSSVIKKEMEKILWYIHQNY